MRTARRYEIRLIQVTQQERPPMASGKRKHNFSGLLSKQTNQRILDRLPENTEVRQQLSPPCSVSRGIKHMVLLYNIDSGTVSRTSILRPERRLVKAGLWSGGFGEGLQHSTVLHSHYVTTGKTATVPCMLQSRLQ